LRSPFDSQVSLG